MFTFTSHFSTCTPCHHRIDEADEHWMQTQDVSTFVSRFWRESCRFVASVLTRLPGSPLLWPASEGGSCVLGVIAHVIHTSPPPLYTSPGPVRGSTYPVRDLWSCLVIPVLTFLLHTESLLLTVMLHELSAFLPVLLESTVWRICHDPVVHHHNKNEPH